MCTTDDLCISVKLRGLRWLKKVSAGAQTKPPVSPKLIMAQNLMDSWQLQGFIPIPLVRQTMYHTPLVYMGVSLSC